MIIVYSKTTCPACKVLKSKLANKGIIFEEINIDEDSSAKDLLILAGFKSVPQLSKDGRFISIEDL